MLLLLALAGCGATWTRLPDDTGVLDTADYPDTADSRETAVETGDSDTDTDSDADSDSDTDSDTDTDTDTDADSDTGSDTGSETGSETGSDTDTDTDSGPPTDIDGDGYSVDDGDCDDEDPLVNPGMTEVCDAGHVDEDCDGLADDADSDASGKIVTFSDADGDGYAADDAVAQEWCEPPAGTTQELGDCDDTNTAVYPGAPDDAGGDELDDDCDGFIDEDGLSSGELIFTEMYWRGDDVIDYGTYQASGPQWVELVNRRADRVHLDGWQLRLCLVAGGSVTAPPDAASCDATTETTYTFGALTIEPGDRLVVCSEDFVGCDLVVPFTEAMAIRNGWMELSHEGERMDALAWWYISETDFWPSSSSRSMRLGDDVLAAATDDLSNDEYGAGYTDWCKADTTSTWTRATTGTAYGSPGADNGTCP